jgi:hypothetical protein
MLETLGMHVFVSLTVAMMCARMPQKVTSRTPAAKGPQMHNQMVKKLEQH